MSSILKMGHPLLSCRSSEVEDFNSPNLDGLVKLLLETQQEHQGAGLAAPQVGINSRVICLGGATTRYPQAQDSEVLLLINPTFAPLSDEVIEGWEGCLSVPGLKGLVPRYYAVRYKGFDALGNSVAGELEGFMARVLQHECDHLDGVLFPERIENFKKFGYEESLVSELERDLI